MGLHNTFLSKLREGKILLGVQNRSRSSMVAEIYALCGIDYMFIENEHFTYDPTGLANLIQTSDGVGIDSIVRISQFSQGQVLQTLDAGASGIFVPHIDTEADAKAFVDAGKYAPAGNRGFSDGARAASYGLFDRSKFFEETNATVALIPFIESAEAVENLDSILQSGIDAVHIGPGDLAVSMGVPVGSNEQKKAIQKIIDSCNYAGIPCGMPAQNIEEAINWVEHGCRFITLSSDLGIIRDACLSFVDSFRSKF